MEQRKLFSRLEPRPTLLRAEHYGYPVCPLLHFPRI